jgi:hypothetical protein
MRLINANTLQLEYFIGGKVPRYAILSHRWEEEEVQFEDISNESSHSMKGFRKIRWACIQAVSDGLEYVWVDTCCIDKSSSAELSESINSMFNWYKRSEVCYAFLSDVEGPLVPQDAHFAKSVWFTRGWTLQELIAPSRVLFYSKSWDELGSRTSLNQDISAITGIDVKVLEGADPSDFSIAQRMAWASNRVTTRPEDIAYSLIGLFAVNMSLLYGEEDRAFIRLQEEIMKDSSDMTLFVWKFDDSGYTGLLAKSPADFADCRHYTQSHAKSIRQPFSMTNLGLSIQLPMIPWTLDVYLALLDCEENGKKERQVGIFLEMLPEHGQYARVRAKVAGEDRHVFDPKELLLQPRHSQYRTARIRQRKIGFARDTVDPLYGFWIRTLPSKASLFGELNDVTAWHGWKLKERILEIPDGSWGTAGILWFAGDMLKLGLDRDFNPVLTIWGRWRYSWPRTRDSLNQYYKGKPLSNAWIDEVPEQDDTVVKGSNRTGLLFEPENRYSIKSSIKIMMELVEGRPMWVVDCFIGCGPWRTKP